MRHLILSICCLFVATSQSFSNNNSVLKNLTSVNAEWLKQSERDFIIQSFSCQQPQSFNEWIAAHLMLVEQTLKARDVSKLSASQKENRFKLLQELNGYGKAGVFPVNDYVAYKTPVFIDRRGTHCAVGYLMQQSGAEALAQKINAEQKYAYVHEIKIEGVKAWADANGFTVDELAWIQPGYPITLPAQSMEGGLDGNVNAIAVHQQGLAVYAAGSFSKTTKGITCNNIAAYISGFAGFDWISVGAGVNGTVHALIVENNKLYAGGEFSTAGSVAAGRVAVYDINLGQWQALGSLDSTVRALTFYKGELYAAGDFTGFLAKWNGTAWQDVSQGMLYGKGANALQVWDTLLVVGGNFELATGALRKHVIAFDGIQPMLLGMGTPTPVNDLEIHQGKLYAACKVIDGNDTCALAVFNQEINEWQVEIKPNKGIADGFEGNAIFKLQSFGSSLIVGGDFFCSSGMTFGNNLMEIKNQKFPGDTTVYKILNPLAITDKPVHAISFELNTVYFGGDFLTNKYTDTLNHIASLQLAPNAVKNIADNTIQISLFPNPVSDVLTIKSLDNSEIKRVEIYDAIGRNAFGENFVANRLNSSSKCVLASNFCSTEFVSNQQSISLKSLTPGIYSVRILVNNNWSFSKLVKE